MVATVKPRRARPVDEGDVPRLKADVAESGPKRFQIGYEIELADRAAGEAGDWSNLRWSYAGDAWKDHPEVDDPPEPGPEGPKVPRPWIARIDSRPALRGSQRRRLRRRMKSFETRPTFLVYSREPVSGIEWVLSDDERELDDSARSDTAVVSSDGHWIRFRPRKHLRRTRELKEVRPRRNRFFQPFEPPRTSRVPRAYKGTTYGGHPTWAVDFNRGSGRTDKGDPVYASAPGTVAYVVISNGEVGISHDGGWQTRYAHMDPVEVADGASVEPWTRLGKVSDKGNATGPHLHYQQLKNGVEKEVKFRGEVYDLGTRDPGWRRPFGKSVARVRVRVIRRSDGEPSPWRWMRLDVARQDTKRNAPEIDVLCEGADLPAGEYSVRYRSIDDQGTPSEWVADHSLRVREVGQQG